MSSGNNDKTVMLEMPIPIRRHLYIETSPAAYATIINN